jgi:undecaprenyl-diphosphatase
MLYIKDLLAFIANHPTIAYGVVFLVSLSESLALVGLIVPGTVIMFGVGAIVATGSLGLWPVLLLAFIGAVCGDGISFWMGHHYQEKLRKVWPFSRHVGLLANGELFFQRHGGKSVLFGRFVGPVRPVIPVVAGMLGMGPLHFTVINVLSAIGWAMVYILPGVLFGTSLAVAGAVSTRLAVLIFFILVTAWFFIWLIRKLVLLMGYQGPIWFTATKEWAVADTSVHWTILPVKRFFSYLFSRQQGEEVFFALLVLVLFVAGFAFLGVMEDVLAKDPLVLADQSVYHFFQSLRTPWTDNVFVAITELGDSFVNICLSSAVLFVLLGKRCYRTAGYWAITVLGGVASVLLLKWIIHLPRPVTLYQGASVYGFPSGHAAMSVILYGFVAILLAKGLPGILRWFFFASAFLFSFLIAISRLYLGAHWLSDVLGGFLIGMSWTALLGIMYLKRQDERIPRRLLVLVVIFGLVIAGSWHVSQRHEKDLAFYAPKYTVQTMALSTWLADGWRALPAWRIDMAGEQEEPLTIQWAGSLDELAHYLLAEQWQRPPSLSMKNLLLMLFPDISIEKLPLLPRLHNGRTDSLSLIRKVADKRWVLRMWPADMKTTENDLPLFVGTIEVQKPGYVAGLITLARDSGEYELPLDTFKQMLNARFFMKSVYQAGDKIRGNDEYRQFHWQGNLLLVAAHRYSLQH